MAGKVPPETVGTAAVKPLPDVDARVLSAFSHSCEAVLAAGLRQPSLRTVVRHSHPWFGPLDPAGWHFMAGFRLVLHRSQIERILMGLHGAK